MQEANQKDSASSVTIYAVSMALGTLLSRVLGLVRDLLFAAMFSPTVRDAWTAAFRLPNLFRRILGEGSLSVNFIPVFVQVRVQDPQGPSAQNLVNSFYTLLLLLLSVLTVLGVLFPEAFLHVLLDAKYSEVPGKFELTVRMTRIMFCFIFFMSTFAFFMGILNALGKYSLPAMAPTLFNVAMIIANFIPQNILPMPGDAIAWGVVLGGMLQTVVLLPALHRAGYLPRLTKNLWNPKVLQILKNMLPGMLGLGLMQITTVVNMRFASALGEGPITYIYLADRLLELPLSLVSVSLGTALLPTLSQLWSKQEKEKFNSTVRYYFNLNLYIAIPAALGLLFLAGPIVDLLFQRGQFSPADAAQTALVVKIYSLILISSSCVRVLVPSFYAIQNTKVPAISSGLALIAHVLLAPSLMKTYGLGGLMLSSFVSGSLNLAFLFFFYRRHIGSFQFWALLKKIFVFAFAASFMVMVLMAYPLIEDLVHSLVEWKLMLKFLSLLIVVTISILVYFSISRMLKIDEYQQSSDLLFGKLQRRLGKFWKRG